MGDDMNTILMTFRLFLVSAVFIFGILLSSSLVYGQPNPSQRTVEQANEMADAFLSCVTTGQVFVISPDGSQMIIVQCRAKIVNAGPERKDRP